MKGYLNKMIFAFIVCLVIFSCNSESKQTSKQQASKTDKETVFILTAYNTKKDQNIQTYDINTSKNQIIKGKQGTVVTFPAQCFGKTQGKVKIELIECYSIQDMVLNGLSTQTTDGKLLESDGMIYLNALNEKGDTLEIKQGKVSVKMPTKQRKTDIRIFGGIENTHKITWNLLSNKIKQEIEPKNNQVEEEYLEDIPCCEDSITYSKAKTVIIDKQIKNENLVNYIFNISKMGWQNCDRFIEGKTKQLTVNVPKESTGASYYLVLKNYNSSALPKQTTDGKLSFVIPINEPFTIVALSSKGEDIYFNMIDYTGGKEEVDFSGLKPITRQELTDLLMRKFGKDIWSRPLA